MSEKSPIVIDADAFDPIPQHVFRLNGRDYRALSTLQLTNAHREKVVRFDEHFKACTSFDAQLSLCVEIIAAYVPGAPVDEIRNAPLEKLLRCIGALAVAGSQDGEERPTTGQRKSGSRRNTRR